jgi:hypothetical protein
MGGCREYVGANLGTQIASSVAAERNSRAMLCENPSAECSESLALRARDSVAIVTPTRSVHAGSVARSGPWRWREQPEVGDG